MCQSGFDSTILDAENFLASIGHEEEEFVYYGDANDVDEIHNGQSYLLDNAADVSEEIDWEMFHEAIKESSYSDFERSMRRLLNKLKTSDAAAQKWKDSLEKESEKTNTQRERSMQLERNLKDLTLQVRLLESELEEYARDAEKSAKEITQMKEVLRLERERSTRIQNDLTEVTRSSALEKDILTQRIVQLSGELHEVREGQRVPKRLFTDHSMGKTPQKQEDLVERSRPCIEYLSNFVPRLIEGDQVNQEQIRKDYSTSEIQATRVENELVQRRSDQESITTCRHCGRVSAQNDFHERDQGHQESYTGQHRISEKLRNLNEKTDIVSRRTSLNEKTDDVSSRNSLSECCIEENPKERHLANPFHNILDVNLSGNELISLELKNILDKRGDDASENDQTPCALLKTARPFPDFCFVHLLGFLAYTFLHSAKEKVLCTVPTTALVLSSNYLAYTYLAREKRQNKRSFLTFLGMISFSALLHVILLGKKDFKQFLIGHMFSSLISYLVMPSSGRIGVERKSCPVHNSCSCATCNGNVACNEELQQGCNVE